MSKRGATTLFRGIPFIRNDRGAVAIEFAFLAFPFFLVLLAILEISVLLTASMQFENAVDRISRRVMTGEIGKQEADIRSSLCAEIVFSVDCSKILVDYREIDNIASFDLPDPFDGRKVRASAFQYITKTTPSFSSLRAGYEWPIAIKPLIVFLANLDSQRHLIVSTALARVER